MQTIVLDFETFYDDQYSLRKMTAVEYILGPRFETIGCAVKYLGGNNPPAYWIDGPDLPAFFASLDPKETSLVSHNALFDMSIVAWRYSFVPRLMVDTLGISRALLGHVLQRHGLEYVALHLGLGVKGGALPKVKGMNLAMIKAAGLYDEFVEYGLNDAELCAGIYNWAVPTKRFPVSELVVNDMLLRACTLPRFVLDRGVLATYQARIVQEKEQLLQRAVQLGADGRSTLMSNEAFAGLLRELGVDPPMKVSPVTGREAYAFAKTDTAFIDLLEHDDPDVQTLVSARLGHKSTIEETRVARFASIANLQWPGYLAGNPWMPMPMRYAGAHTHRFSGEWKLNVQNLPRPKKEEEVGEDGKIHKVIIRGLRHALAVPEGHVVLSVDASQIEARMVAWLCGQEDLIEMFARGEDVYSDFASRVFGFPVNKEDHPSERFVGKQAVLGLGYGLGAPKFQSRIKTDSRNQLGYVVELSLDQAKGVVTTYRTTFPFIPHAWKVLNYTGIPVLAHGGSFTFGPVVFSKGQIQLPSGLHLHYHDLQQIDGEWRFTYGGKPKRLYGGALLENISQSLARITITDAATRILRRTGRSFQLQVHDELVYVIPAEAADEMRPIMLEEMRRRPTWAPELPLDAEASKPASCYGEAK